MKDAQGHGSGTRGGMSEADKDKQVVNNIRGWLGAPPAHQTGVEAARNAPSSLGRHGYNPAAVNNAIGASNRAGRRIGGKEASAIHRLLRGR